MIEAVCSARKLIKRLGYFQKHIKQELPGRRGWMGATHIAPSINDLTGIPYPCVIKTFSLKEISPNLEAKVMSYVKIGQDDEITIFVNRDNNYCWRRFFICKEIIHVLASNQTNVTIGFDRISEVIEKIQQDNLLPQGMDEAYDIEMDAQLGAIELLLPKELVEAEDRRVGDYSKYTDEDIDRISELYKVPKLIVKPRLTIASVRRAFESCYSDPKFINISR